MALGLIAIAIGLSAWQKLGLEWQLLIAYSSYYRTVNICWLYISNSLYYQTTLVSDSYYFCYVNSCFSSC